ncbi:MAG: hypothetical protein ABI604_16035 [Nitrospirota bacterium]
MRLTTRSGSGFADCKKKRLPKRFFAKAALILTEISLELNRTFALCPRLQTVLRSKAGLPAEALVKAGGGQVKLSHH